MFAMFLERDDIRLDKIGTYIVEILRGDGLVLDTQLLQNSSLNKIFDVLNNKYADGVDMSVLDYGDELRGIVTPITKSYTHSYVITHKPLQI